MARSFRLFVVNFKRLISDKRLNRFFDNAVVQYRHNDDTRPNADRACSIQLVLAKRQRRLYNKCRDAFI